MKKNISRRHTNTQTIHGQCGGVRGHKGSVILWNVEWRLGIDGPGVVDVTLGWNQDKFGLQAAV